MSVGETDHGVVPKRRAFCLLEPKGTIISCNKRLLSLLNKDLAGIVGFSCNKAFGCSPESEKNCPLQKTLANRESVSIKVEHANQCFSERTDPLFDRDGNVSAVILSVSEPVRGAAPDLMQLERLATMAQATSGVAHDFNNIFTGTRGAIDLLKMQHGLDTDPMMRLLESSVEQGRVLAEQLLSFGKGHHADKNKVMIQEIIRQAVAFAGIGKPGKPTIKMQEDLWPVMANAGQLAQLVSNLILNAIHASGSSIKVWIAAENVDKDTAQSIGLPHRDFVAITIRDEGPGILPEHMEYMFQPFFTTKKTGTGLGLATAKLIVQEHEGRISVESKPSQGATFKVHLPAFLGAPVDKDAQVVAGAY